MDFDHGNGSNKYSRTDIEESDGSGSSKLSSEESGSNEHSRRHLELGDRSSKHSDNCPEVINGSGRIESNHFEVNPEIIEGWGNNNSFEIHPELTEGSESSKRSEVIQQEINRIEGDIPSSAEKLRLSSFSSSSSSGSSSDDQFQEDIKLSKSRSGISSTSSPKHDEDTQQSHKDKHHVSGSNSSKSAEFQNGSVGPALTSQVSSITVTHDSTLTQSPPIQEMDRLGEFDPNRIPSAVFARSKSTTPADWSIASNESLFSIQVGNNSFCRDISLKSGELFKSGEFFAFSPPIVPLVDADKNSIGLDKRESAVVSDNAVKDKTDPCAEEPTQEKPTHPVVSWNSSISNSVNSVTSAHSFAFPIRNKKKKKQKQKKSAWPSCYCSNCSWAFCYCTWPSCYSRWPSCYCSSCSCVFCYGWNCSIKGWCCHFFTVLSDGRNLSRKEKAEQQQQQQQQQKEQPLAISSKSARCNCWSWFPSCQWKWHWQWCSCLNCCRGSCF